MILSQESYFFLECDGSDKLLSRCRRPESLLNMSNRVLTLGLILFILIRGLFLNLDVLKDITKNPAFAKSSSCRTFGDSKKITPSVEDFRFISQNLIILGSSQIVHWFEEGDKVEPLGKLVAADLTTEKMKALELINFPKGIAFRPHGLDFSPRTNRLYVVNHANNGEERIEIFAVSNPESLETVELKWITSFHPVSVGKGLINSVTEVSENEIVFTYWIGYPVPEGGTNHPKTFTEFLNVLGIAWGLAGWKFIGLPPHLVGGTGFYHCNLQTNKCARHPYKNHTYTYYE